MTADPTITTAHPPVAQPADDPHTPSPAVHRVLTLSADMGGGHDATAGAIEAAVQRLWPDSELRRLDTLAVLGPGVGRVFRSIYVTNVETTPWLYEFFYASLWRHRWFANASKRFTGSWCGRRLAGHIERFDPDVIVSTYPIGTTALGWLRRYRGLAVPAAAYVSDFAPHPFWINADVDANFVMHAAAVPAARAAAPGAVVDVSGAPVLDRFHPGDAATARQATGLRSDAFVVLVSCGAYAFGRLERTVRMLADISAKVQVVVTCGRNTDTYERLQALGLPTDRLLPLGWTDEMPALVRAADVVLTNAGGATALEALASGRPVLMFRPIAAHGYANAVLMAVSGLAHVCTTEAELVEQVRSAVAHPHVLHGLAAAAREHTDSHDLTIGLRRLIDPDSRPPVPTSRPWPMRAADSLFLHGDGGPRPQELGAMLELGESASGQPLTLERLRADVDRRLASLAVLRRRAWRQPRPGWLLQTRVDVAEHVHELRPRAGESVESVLDEFWARPLEPDRPGWALALVRDPETSRTVVAAKLHHAWADGVGALALLDRLLEPAPSDPLPERGRFGHRSDEPAPVDVRGSRVDTRGRRDDPEQPQPLSDRVVATGRALWWLATRRRSSVHRRNTGVDGPARRFIAVPLPAARVRGAAQRLRASERDVLLAVVADALGHLLGSAGLVTSGQPLRTLVPVASRSGLLDRVFGNWAGAVTVDLPVQPMPVAARVQAIRTQVHERTRRAEPAATFAATSVVGRLPMRAQSALVRRGYGRGRFDTIVSQLPALRSARWCAGAPVRAVYPVVPLAAGVPVTVGLVGFDHTVGIGVLVDAGLGHDRTGAGGGLDTAAVTAAVTAAFERACDDDE